MVQYLTCCGSFCQESPEPGIVQMRGAQVRLKKHLETFAKTCGGPSRIALTAPLLAVEVSGIGDLDRVHFARMTGCLSPIQSGRLPSVQLFVAYRPEVPGGGLIVDACCTQQLGHIWVVQLDLDVECRCRNRVIECTTDRERQRGGSYINLNVDGFLVAT